jgi:hypothetical protein
MPDTKFVFTVSGVQLSEAQQHKVSAAIGSAVALALGEGTTHAVRSDFLNIGRIHGGLWIDVAELQKVGVQKVLESPAVTGAGARAG